MDRILLWKRHDRCRDQGCSTVAWQCRIRRRLCRVRWLRRQFRVTSEYGCYRSADAAITYPQRQASMTLDQITLIGWSLGSAVALDLASRRNVRTQVLLSPLSSLLSCALDLVRIGKTSFAIGPFDALSRARSVNCPTLIIGGSEG